MSHSNFCSADSVTAREMGRALKTLRDTLPDVEIKGEMRADINLNEELCIRVFFDSRTRGQANLLNVPTIDAANSVFNLVKVLGEAVSICNTLLGATRPVNIGTPSITVCVLVNILALTVVDAHEETKDQTNCPAA